jgi:hypothetical protein
VLVLTAVSAGLVLFARSPGAGDSFPGVLPAPCANPLRVVTAASFAPVLTALEPALGKGADCVRLDVDLVEGRAAAGRAGQADVWIPDDGAWIGTAKSTAVAGEGMGGSGTMLATSPIYMVADQATADRLKAAGGSWLALANLLRAGSGVKLAVRDPGGSGDGLVAAGAVAEAVWLDKGMDASALALAQVLRVTHTVTGAAAALPTAPGEVGLVPEYALLPALGRLGADSVVLAGSDHTATMRFTWTPSAAAAADPTRGPGLRRLLDALTGPAAAGRPGYDRRPRCRHRTQRRPPAPPRRHRPADRLPGLPCPRPLAPRPRPHRSFRRCPPSHSGCSSRTTSTTCSRPGTRRIAG